MSNKKKKDYVEVPENWDSMTEEEQNQFVDDLIKKWVPKD